MTFISYFNSHFTLAQNLDLCLRLVLASICGAAIGFERSRRFKEAGIRTHIIVCCAAALMMLVSKYGFADLTLPDGSNFAGVRGADSARIAAQVVSGISFLCAGVIFKNAGTVKGLTTAAGIWVTAGIGLGVAYFVGKMVGRAQSRVNGEPVQHQAQKQAPAAMRPSTGRRMFEGLEMKARLYFFRRLKSISGSNSERWFVTSRKRSFSGSFSPPLRCARTLQ